MSERSDSTELRRRVLLAAVGFVLFAVFARIALEFLAVLTFAVFLYYSTRPIYRFLRRFGLPRQLRAALAVAIFSVPFVGLSGYVVLIVLAEGRLAVEQYDLETEILDWLDGELGLAEIELEELGQQLAGMELEALASASVSLLTEAAGLVANVALQLLIVFVLLYYFLIDGGRLRRWAIGRFDETGVLEAYASRVDSELSAVLFGNIINAFLTGLVGIIVYYAYNAVAPPLVRVPFPALVGGITGAASLIPVVGMKLVYVPVALGLATAAVLAGETALIVYVVAFVLVTFVFVDSIPDFFIRPFVSGKDTHIGLLMLAYIVGPLVFGFYGVFLGPILLVLGIQFVRVVLPYVIAGDHPDVPEYRPGERQTELSEFRRVHDPPPIGDAETETD